MKPIYYILDGHTPVATESVLEWARFFKDLANRLVRLAPLPNEVRVSTVFLGLEHNWDPAGPPLLFETMIFGGPHNDFQERYSTWDQAVIGHEAAVKIAMEPKDGTSTLPECD